MMVTVLEAGKDTECGVREYETKCEVTLTAWP